MWLLYTALVFYLFHSDSCKWPRFGVWYGQNNNFPDKGLWQKARSPVLQIHVSCNAYQNAVSDRKQQHRE